jgi:hypothetical protein
LDTFDGGEAEALVQYSMRSRPLLPLCIASQARRKAGLEESARERLSVSVIERLGPALSRPRMSAKAAGGAAIRLPCPCTRKAYPPGVGLSLLRCSMRLVSDTSTLITPRRRIGQTALETEPRGPPSRAGPVRRLRRASHHCRAKPRCGEMDPDGPLLRSEQSSQDRRIGCGATGQPGCTPGRSTRPAPK